MRYRVTLFRVLTEWHCVVTQFREDPQDMYGVKKTYAFDMGSSDPDSLQEALMYLVEAMDNEPF